MKKIEIFDGGNYSRIKIDPYISVEEYRIICGFLNKTLHRASHESYLKNRYRSIATGTAREWGLSENVAFWKEAIPFLEALGYKVVQK